MLFSLISGLVALLWPFAALLFPALETMHALQASSEQRSMWLCYWLCYAIGFGLLKEFERLCGFAMSIIPLFNEALLCLVIYLVSPRTRGVRKLQSKLEKARAWANEQSSALGLKALAARGPAREVQDTMGHGPGMYCILAPAAVTTSFQPRPETIVKQLNVGDTVQVLAVVWDGPKLRAKVEEPKGWISLLNTESGKKWAQSCEGTALDGVGLQNGLAAAAATVGCDPAMLMQAAGTCSGKAPAPDAEVDAALAWEAVALLESQLERADDPSEAPGARQAASLLKTMLTTLASGGNPAALAMAKTLVPDIGIIWAHEGARDYLRALLLGAEAAQAAPAAPATPAAPASQ